MIYFGPVSNRIHIDIDNTALTGGLAGVLSFDGVHILQALWKYIGPRPVGVCTKFRLPSIETNRSDCRSEHMRARLVKLLLCTRLRVRTGGDVPEDDLKHDRAAHGAISALLCFQRVRGVLVSVLEVYVYVPPPGRYHTENAR